MSLFEKELFHPAPHFLPINKSCHECFTTRCSSKKDYYFELVNESVKCVKSDLYLEKYTRHFSWTHSMSFLCNFHYLPRVTVNDQGVVAFRIWIKTQQVWSNNIDDYKSRKFYIIIFAKVSSTPCMLLHFGGKIDCFLRLLLQQQQIFTTQHPFGLAPAKSHYLWYEKLTLIYTVWISAEFFSDWKIDLFG